MFLPASSRLLDTNHWTRSLVPANAGSYQIGITPLAFEIKYRIEA